MQRKITEMRAWMRALPDKIKGSANPLIIALLIAGFGSLTFSIKTLYLGYFHDDWHHVYYAYHHGLQGLRQFLYFDSRPFAYLVYAPYFALLGYKAFHWHLLAVFLRLSVALMFWAVMNQISPNFKKRNGLTALFFLFYPVFQLQPHAVTYALHWSLYLVFMLSIFFMIRATRSKKLFLPFTILSLLLEAFHLVMLEYFAGIELMRPFLLWFVVGQLPRMERLKKVVKHWLPYFTLLFVYAVFRASFSATLGYDRNAPVILFGLFTKPLASILFLLQATVQDLTDVLLTAWNPTYDPVSLNFSVFTNLWTWGFAALSAFLIGLSFYLVQEQTEEGHRQAEIWARSSAILGLIITVLGLLPGWIIGRTFFQMYDFYDDRFALPAMFGASMLWVGGIFYLFRKQNHAYLLACILLGLAIGLQLRTNAEHARAWDKQRQFYWQLYWRAPYLEPGTALISEGEIFPLMGAHPTMYAINALYPKNETYPGLGYSFFPSGKGVTDWERFRQGMVLQDDRFGSRFEGLSTDSITILYLPEEGQCLWILRPEDKRIRNMPALTYESLSVSNLNRIRREPKAKDYPLTDIYGPEPEHTWCYFYQKADLARQYADWGKVTSLWVEAGRSHLLPGSGIEYMPFIQAFAQAGDWQKAADLTVSASKLGKNTRPALCELWRDALLPLESSAEKSEAVSQINKKLQCNIGVQ